MHVAPVKHEWIVGVKKSVFFGHILFFLICLIHMDVSVLLNQTAEDVTLDVQQRSGI